MFPPVRFLSAKALAKVDAFARAGGKVLFLGGPPEWIVDKTYRDSMSGRDHKFFRELPAGVHLSAQLDASALSHLPGSDVLLSPATPDVKYLHRSLEDAEVYFLFNEGAKRLAVEASLEGTGRAQLWDPRTGERTVLPATVSKGMLRVPLVLEPYETAVLVLGALSPDAPAARPTRFRKLSELSGNWELEAGGKPINGPLKSWPDLGMPGYFGTGVYKKQFTIPSGSSMKDLWLDLGTVQYAARVRINGKDLGRRAWGPFRWDISSVARPGSNTLEIEVANTRANELAGDSTRFKEIESKGWLKNSYVNMYLKFDQEMISSGLLGPVVLATVDPAP